MIKNRKFSLSLVNSVLLALFLFILLIGIFTSLYLTTQKVVNYNINEYFKQTYNITKIILESEQKDLNDISFDIVKLADEKGFESETFYSDIDSIVAVDQIDLLFIKDENGVKDYSNSLFDTQAIIKKILEKSVLTNNSILSIETNDEKYILLLSSKRIIDQKTGRVSGRLFTGKLLNDNFQIINKIKQKASLEDVHIYFEDELIATTSNKEIFDFSLFKDNEIIKKNEHLLLNKKQKLYFGNEFDIVFVAKNSTFELLKDDFTIKGYFLIFFVLVLFGVFYFLSNVFIIKPFSKLANYARKLKDHEYVKYRKTRITEFDEFAVDLKSIIDELKELKEQYSRAIDGVGDGLWDYDLRRKNVFYSNRFLQMLGYSSEDCVNKLSFWKESVHKDDYMKTLRKLVHHIQGKSAFYEDDYRFRCKDGSYRWIRVRGKVFLNEYRKLIRITGFHTDIEEFVKLQDDNKRKEQMLYQQSKLASMGEIIGNIAHQWRQPLNVISTVVSSQMIQIELGLSKEDALLKDLNRLNDTVQYLSTIIDKFRYFFSPNNKAEEFFIDEAIRENLEIFEASYNASRIKLITNLKKVELIGYKFELMQVIINIINNSKDAFDNSIDSNEKKFVFLNLKKENNFAIIEIYDNAGGIDSKIKEKIYEPYFTTKHQSQGTGLGLYMSNEIIKKHFKGEIDNETVEFEYKDEKYTGEKFRIKLPFGAEG